MARAGDVIENPVIGDRLIFRRTLPTPMAPCSNLISSRAQARRVLQLARSGQTDRNGVPGVLQLSVFAPSYFDTNHIVRPPLAVQRLLFGLLSPLARRLGYLPDTPYPYPAHAPGPTVE
jgi:hypothetical protein